MKYLLNLSVLVLSISAITGCGSQRSITLTQATRLADSGPSEPTAKAAPSFTMTAQPGSVKAPLPAPVGAIGVGYDSDASISVELTSVNFIGQVNLSLSDLPSGVTPASPVAPVSLDFGGAPAVQVIPVELYVLPSVLSGSYSFSVIGTPAPGSNSTAAVTTPLVLTVTSAASAAWSAQ